MQDLRQMSAIIAGGIASVLGHQEATLTAKRSIDIALEIDKQVSELEKTQNAEQPVGPPEPIAELEKTLSLNPV